MKSKGTASIILRNKANDIIVAIDGLTIDTPILKVEDNEYQINIGNLNTSIHDSEHDINIDKLCMNLSFNKDE